ncbi:MAG: PQQ-binding-like beta-propeller repeat protein [Proteobacteria bacterium]|nr:PQQ-binding-like beta-propeller repeat protein [Pseudomonadota bacterium]
MTRRLIRLAILATTLSTASPAATADAPGIPGIRHPVADLHPAATLKLGKTADWVDITPDSVWVGATSPNSVTRIDPRTNRKVATVELPGEPCAGLVSGFGALWIPLCGAKPGLARVDMKTNRLDRVIPLGVKAEGGVTASGDSLWLVVDDAGTLVRLDPETGSVRQRIKIAPGSHNPLYAQGVVWITDVAGAQITAVDAATGKVLGETPTGPNPRFLTTGSGALWTLNQGDGTLTRIDARTRKPVATIALGTPGHGGDIAWGGGRIWTTLSGVPLSETDPRRNRPVRQWTGSGGDSLKVGFGAVWLTDYKGGTVARLALRGLGRPASRPR